MNFERIQATMLIELFSDEEAQNNLCEAIGADKARELGQGMINAADAYEARQAEEEETDAVSDTD